MNREAANDDGTWQSIRHKGMKQKAIGTFFLFIIVFLTLLPLFYYLAIFLFCFGCIIEVPDKYQDNGTLPYPRDEIDKHVTVPRPARMLQAQPDEQAPTLPTSSPLATILRNITWGRIWQGHTLYYADGLDFVVPHPASLKNDPTTDTPLGQARRFILVGSSGPYYPDVGTIIMELTLDENASTTTVPSDMTEPPGVNVTIRNVTYLPASGLLNNVPSNFQILESARGSSSGTNENGESYVMYVMTEGKSVDDQLRRHRLYKVTSEGHVTWSREILGGDHWTEIHRENGMTIDPSDGSVYITGWASPGTRYQSISGFFAKYSASGDLLWLIEYPSSADLPSDAWVIYPKLVTIDRLDGTLLVAAEGIPKVRLMNADPLQEPSWTDLVLLKYRPDGSLLWMRAWDITYREQPLVLEQLANGDFIVGLSTESPPRDEEDLKNTIRWLLRTDPGLVYVTRDGNAEWARVWGRPEEFDGLALSLEVDEVNDVIFVAVGLDDDLSNPRGASLWTDLYVISLHEGKMLGNWTLLDETIRDTVGNLYLSDLYLDVETQRLYGAGYLGWKNRNYHIGDGDFFLVEYQLHPDQYPPHIVDDVTSLPPWWYLNEEESLSKDAGAAMAELLETTGVVLVPSLVVAGIVMLVVDHVKKRRRYTQNGGEPGNNKV